MPKTAEEIAAEEQAAAEAAAAAQAATDATNGFPSGTAVKDMTPEQQAAYNLHQSRKWEGIAKSRSDYDDLKAKAARLDQIEAESLSAQEKAVREAAEAARMEGENIGAERYLKDAVKANFRAITGLSIEDVDKAFGHVDAKSFIGQDGDIDQTALDEFASTFGTKVTPGQKSLNPVREALGHQQPAGGSGGGAGSVEDVRRQRAEALAARK